MMDPQPHAVATLPPPVAALVDGAGLGDKVGQTISILTVGDDGWPRLSLLSVGELLSTSGADIRLALHAHSGTTAALTASGRAMLHVVCDATVYKIRVLVHRLDPQPAPGSGGDVELAFFAGDVCRVDEDRVAYAELTSGITYRLDDPAAVVERWTRQVDRLKALT
jgi:hypothetical protein